MREALFILVVLAVLFGLTLIRYRKQIAGMIGLARTLKKIREGSVKHGERDSSQSVALVNCSKCGVWVPQDRARQVKSQYYCSDTCLRTPAVT